MGVSPSTVSNVLNNKGGVGDELRDNIKSVLLKNGYILKQAPPISPAKPRNILFLYYQSANYQSLRNNDILPLTLREIEQYCQIYDHHFIFKQANYNSLDAMLDKQNLTDIDGILILGTEYYHRPSPTFYACGKPIVILDGLYPEDSISTVNIDNAFGVYKLAEYIYDMGHRHIGYIKSRMPFGCLRDRTNSLYCALAQFNIALDKSDILEVSTESGLIQDEVTQFFANRDNLPTIFFADNDFLAVSSVQAIQRLGYTVPDDISIVGFDDLDICTLLKPHLTTSRVDFSGMARVAIKHLMNLIAEPDFPLTKLTVATEFIERDSVKKLSD